MNHLLNNELNRKQKQKQKKFNQEQILKVEMKDLDMKTRYIKKGMTDNMEKSTEMASKPRSNKKQRDRSKEEVGQKAGKTWKYKTKEGDFDTYQQWLFQFLGEKMKKEEKLRTKHNN